MAQQVNCAPDRHTPLQVSSPVKDMEDAQHEQTSGEHTRGRLQTDQPAVEDSNKDKAEQALAVRSMLWVWCWSVCGVWYNNEAMWCCLL